LLTAVKWLIILLKLKHSIAFIIFNSISQTKEIAVPPEKLAQESRG
jgi:hypothetical protein